MSAHRGDLVPDLARQRARSDQLRFGAFDPRALTWLALLPRWTAGLAARLGLDPENDLLDRLVDADLVEHRRIRTRAGRTVAFWVRASLRGDIGAHARTRGTAAVMTDLDALVEAVARVVDSEPELRPWLTVARQHASSPGGESLIADVDDLLAKEQVGAAASLVATARGVAEIIAGPLVSSASRAQWRIDLALRTAQDLADLRHYFRRHDVERAFDVLLADGGEHWALHVIGDGGLGKTMALRYLCSGQYATDRQRPRFPVARIDFDRLDPRYPMARPAAVLQALADELTGFGVTRTDLQVYRAFTAAADALHEELAGSDPDDARVERLLEQVIDTFVAELAVLPAPVVLIFDTCEELTKLYPAGAAAPAIDRTFFLLERIWQRWPALRVVLAGRRWLVPPPPEDMAGAGGPMLQPRSYLTPFKICGYDRSQAQGYLTARERHRRIEQPDTADLRPALRAAMLDRSIEGGGEPPRYNPFELASYCDWAFADPQLDADSLRDATGDPYVERRVIARLDGAARHGLAVAVEFGRFDRELPTAAWRRSGVDPQAAFDGLAAQEWVNVLATGTDGRPAVLEIDEHLRDRIRAVTRGHPETYPLDRSLLGLDAAEVVDGAAVVDLPAETVEAAVDLLPPAAAAALWARLDERILRDGRPAWAWAAQVTPRVAAVEVARSARFGSDGSTILGSILATNAAALIHAGHPAGLLELWRQVEAVAARHPDTATRPILLGRAGLGRIAAGDPVRDVHLTANAPSAPVGSVVAALFGVLGGGVVGGVLSTALFAAVRAVVDGRVGAALALARFTTAVQEGRITDAVRHAERAIDVLRRSGPDPESADWAPPAGLLDRARLARLYVALLAAEPLGAHPWEEWRADALHRLDDVDAERLVAMSVQFELAHRCIGTNAIEEMEAAERYSGDRKPGYWLHQAVRPLLVELAEAWRVAGRPDHARLLLTTRRDEAVEHRTDPDTVDICDRALLRLDRRLRSARTRSLPKLARGGPPPTRAEAWLVLLLCSGERPSGPADAGSWHGWWQCRDGPAGPVDVAEVLEPVPGISRLTQLADLWEGGPQDRFDWAAEVETAERAVIDLRERTEQLVRLGVPATVTAPGLLGRAQLDAGEMIALHDRDRGVRLLLDGCRHLQDAGDDRSAAHARLLAALAEARSDDHRAEMTWPVGTGPDSAVWGVEASGAADGNEGWLERAEWLRAYLTGARLAPSSASPELDLPVRRPIRWWTRTDPPFELGAEGPPGGQVSTTRPVAPPVQTPSAYGPAGVGPLPSSSPAPAEVSYQVSTPPRSFRIPTVAVAAALVAVAAVLVVSWMLVGEIGRVVLGIVAGMVAAGAGALLVARRDRAGFRFGRARSFRVEPIPEPRLPLKVVVRERRHRGAGELNGSRWPGWPRRSGSYEIVVAPEKWAAESSWRGNAGRARRLVELDVSPELFEQPWELWAASRLGRSVPEVVFRRIAGLRYPAAPDSAFVGPRGIRPSGGPETRYGIVHVVGTPVDTKAGWRLRTQDTGISLSEANVHARGTVAGEQLIGLESLPVWVGTCALLILQAEPADGASGLGVLRTGFLGLAREALELGAGAVLVVPPLPDRTVTAVIEQLWQPRALRQPRPSEIVALMARLLEVAPGPVAADFLLFQRTGRLHR